MKIIVTKNYEDMSQALAAHLLKYMYADNHKRINISITNGSTPLRAYEIASKLIKGKDFPNVHFYNFDEIPFRGYTTGITMRDLNAAFFQPCDIYKDNIHVLNNSNWRKYDKIIQQDGGIDVVLLGIGEDGHFCGNLSGVMQTFDQQTYYVDLKPGSVPYSRVSRHFKQDPGLIPDGYVTFGPKTIMNCRHLILAASGENKVDIVEKMLFGALDVSVPSTIFQLHPNVTLIIDEAAAAKCGERLSSVI